MTFSEALTVAKIVEYEKEKAMKQEGVIGLTDEKEALILLSKMAYGLALILGETSKRANMLMEGEVE